MAVISLSISIIFICCASCSVAFSDLRLVAMSYEKIIDGYDDLAVAQWRNLQPGPSGAAGNACRERVLGDGRLR